MIKRPLLWVLSAYIAGVCLAWLELSVIVLVPSMAFVFFIDYLVMFRSKEKQKHRRDTFLWSLPVLIALGFFIMKEQLRTPDVYDTFDQELQCQITGTVTMTVKKKASTAIYIKNNTILTPDRREYRCENIIVYRYDNTEQEQNISYQQYLIGNQITVTGTLNKFSEAANQGQFNERLYYQIENIDFKMQADQITISDSGYSYYHAFLSKIKNQMIQVYNSILSDREAGVMIAMLLGEKYLLDDEIKTLYQENGISHILAISGLHVSLIGMFVFHLLKRLKVPITLATILSAFFIYSYGALTNFSVSTNRSVVMMIVLLLAGIVGKTYDMLSATALSALLILLQNPLQLFSAGFLLSFSAVLGIAVLLPCLQSLIPTKNSILKSVLMSISAQLATTPVIIWFYYQFPTYGVLTNLIILPMISVLTLTSILAGIAGMIYLPLGIFFIGGANYILKFYEWVCKLGEMLPKNLITVGRPSILTILLYLTFVLGFVFLTKRFQTKYAALLLAGAMLLIFIPSPNTGLEITILDVGQGDAIYMESQSGTTYLVDGGSSDVKDVGTYRILPFLTSQGTDTLDYAIVTHSDSDHTSGLLQLIEGTKIKVRNLMLPLIQDKDEAYEELEALAKEKKIAVKYIQAGDRIVDGEITMFCLHPAADYKASSVNAYSAVFAITYGEFDMLLTGDVQEDGEKLIEDLLLNEEQWLRAGMKPRLDIDVLKVAHHGSKSSSSEEFLMLTKPELTIISCGEDNFYGHPHQEVIERLEQIGSEIKITYETGAVKLETDGERVLIDYYKGDTKE